MENEHTRENNESRYESLVQSFQTTKPYRDPTDMINGTIPFFFLKGSFTSLAKHFHHFVIGDQELSKTFNLIPYTSSTLLIVEEARSEAEKAYLESLGLSPDYSYIDNDGDMIPIATYMASMEEKHTTISTSLQLKGDLLRSTISLIKPIVVPTSQEEDIFI